MTTRVPVASICFLAALAVVAWSASPPARAETASRPTGLFLHGGYSAYAMGDVNDNLDLPTSQFGPVAIQADHIEHGWNADGGLRVWASRSVVLEVSLAYLSAATEGSGTIFGSNYSGELDLSSLALTGSIGSYFWGRGVSRFGLAVGGGYYWTIGDLSIRSATFSASDELDGAGPGFHGAFLFDRHLTGALHLDASAGYRYARSTYFRLGSADIRNEDGSESRIDWSGPFVRLGFALYPARAYEL